jgi:RNA ligase
LARPFHKFFSLGETPNNSNKRGIKKAKVVEKLNGTMVFPLVHSVTNDVRLYTETGTLDDVAIMAETLCNVTINTLRVILNEGYTPIFEFIVPYGSNIIKFDRSSLTLLAVHNTITGTYINNLSTFSQRLGISILTEYSGQLALDTESNKDIILV